MLPTHLYIIHAAFRESCHPGFVRSAFVLAALATILPARADERIQKLLVRLAEEASVFEQAAPNLISEETLRQRVLKSAGAQRHGFGPRIVHPVDPNAPPEWQDRTVESEYAYAKVGNPPSIREVRKVVSVDGKPVSGGKDAIKELMNAVQAKDDRSRRKLLESFEKHGLVGAVTDFGQLLLLFARSQQPEYEFYPVGERLYGAEKCMVFLYRQQEGTGALTVWDEKGESQPRVSGEIWVTESGYRPVKITLKSIRGPEASAVRDEAEVVYVMSDHGVVVPSSVVHKEYRRSRMTTENRFTYAPFRMFGSSTVLEYSTRQ